jgi:hypothetical protein
VGSLMAWLRIKPWRMSLQKCAIYTLDNSTFRRTYAKSSFSQAHTRFTESARSTSSTNTCVGQSPDPGSAGVPPARRRRSQGIQLGWSLIANYKFSVFNGVPSRIFMALAPTPLPPYVARHPFGA